MSTATSGRRGNRKIHGLAAHVGEQDPRIPPVLDQPSGTDLQVRRGGPRPQPPRAIPDRRAAARGDPPRDRTGRMVVVNPTAVAPTAVDPVPSQAGCRVIVTGANTGLGFQTALAFAGAGAEVVLADGTSPAGTLRRSASVSGCRRRPCGCPDRSGRSAVGGLVHRPRGSGRSARRPRCQRGGDARARPAVHRRRVRDAMGVDHIGHAALILGLLPAMSEGSAARIVVVGSTAHWFTRGLDDDLGTTGRYTPMRAYANSKLAGTLFMRELDRRLARPARMSGWSAPTPVGAPPRFWSATTIPVQWFACPGGSPRQWGRLPRRVRGR